MEEKPFKKFREVFIICLIQYSKAGFLWKASIKILNSGKIQKISSMN